MLHEKRKPQDIDVKNVHSTPNQLRTRAGRTEPLRLDSRVCCGRTRARESHRAGASYLVKAADKLARAIWSKLQTKLPQAMWSRLQTNWCELFGRGCRQSRRKLFGRSSKQNWRELFDQSCRQTGASRLLKASNKTSASYLVKAADKATRAIWSKLQTRWRELFGLSCRQIGASYLVKAADRSGASYLVKAAKKTGGSYLVKAAGKLARASWSKLTARSWPRRATETQNDDLLRPRLGRKVPGRLAGTICYGQTRARTSHRDSAVRFVTTQRGPGRGTEIGQHFAR